MTTIATDPDLTIPPTNPDAATTTPPTEPDPTPTPRRRGRPPGSKNKPKAATTPTGGNDSTPKRHGRPKASGNGPSRATVASALQSHVGSLGLLLTMFPANANDGAALLHGAEDWCNATMALADSDPRVMKFLRTAMVGGAWAQFATATAAIAIPIAANHNLFPASLAGFFAGNNDDDNAHSLAREPESASVIGLGLV